MGFSIQATEKSIDLNGFSSWLSIARSPCYHESRSGRGCLGADVLAPPRVFPTNKPGLKGEFLGSTVYPTVYPTMWVIFWRISWFIKFISHNLKGCSTNFVVHRGWSSVMVCVCVCRAARPSMMLWSHMVPGPGRYWIINWYQLVKLIFSYIFSMELGCWRGCASQFLRR